MPTTKSPNDAEKAQETTEESKESGHDRLDAIVENLGHSAQDDAIRALVEFVRENTSSAKLGKRSADEESDG